MTFPGLYRITACILILAVAGLAGYVVGRRHGLEESINHSLFQKVAHVTYNTP